MDARTTPIAAASRLWAIRRSLLIVLLTAFCFGCTHRSITPAEEAQAAQATLRYLDQKTGFIQTRESSQLLKRLALRIEKSVYGRALENDLSREATQRLERYHWRFYLLDDPKPNAYSLGAGVIVVTRGMLLQAETEAQFAAVLCHEAAHQLLGHTREALEIAKEEPRSRRPKTVFTLEQELQADALGLRLLELSGYEIAEARFSLTIDHRQKSQNVSLPPDWLITRMAYLQQRLEVPRRYMPATRSTREYNRVRRLLS